MEENRDISPIIHGAIEVMRKCFGGTDVKLISTEMYRLEPTKDAPAGKIGVDIEVEGIKTFLSYNDFAEDIICSPYGEMIANEFVFHFIKQAHPEMFKENEANNSSKSE